MCFRRQFLHKMWSIQLVFLLFTVCRIFLSSLTIVGYSSPPSQYVILHFLHDKSNWSSPSSSSITFHNFPSISVLFFKVSKFQHNTKLCSSCRTLLVSSLNLNPICWWKVFFLLNAAFDWSEYINIYKEPTWYNLAVCLLVTAIMLYVFRTLFASILRST